MHKLIAGLLVMFGGIVFAQQGYPLDQEMTSVLSGVCSIETSCKVTKVGESYVYMYSIKNKGKVPIKVKWDTISQAMCFGQTLDLLIELAPDENVVFTLEHPDPPVMSHGRLTGFYLTTGDKVAKLLKGTPDLPKSMKIEISKRSFYSSESGSGHGALPKSFVYPKGQYR
jgi:hypothetical protein